MWLGMSYSEWRVMPQCGPSLALSNNAIVGSSSGSATIRQVVKPAESACYDVHLQCARTREFRSRRGCTGALGTEAGRLTRGNGDPTRLPRRRPLRREEPGGRALGKLALPVTAPGRPRVPATVARGPGPAAAAAQAPTLRLPPPLLAGRGAARGAPCGAEAANWVVCR